MNQVEIIPYKITVEYCEQCPFSKERRGKAYCYFNKPRRYIKKDDWQDGIIPEWCPLPKESNQD